MSECHTPVMLEETLALLRIRPGMRVVDATLGCGGHAAAIAERIGAEGVLIGIEWDSDALEVARRRLAGARCDVRICHGNFSDLKDVLAGEGIGRIDALLFDLGVSSLQLDSGARGFSFMAEGPLDMRMDRRRRINAQMLIDRCGGEELERVFREYGEEPLARRIARGIIARRPEGTAELAELVRRIYARAGRRSKIHPATRVFLALRIAVNEELENLRRAIPQAVEVAERGARIAVISFHSLEDRIVKQQFSRAAGRCTCAPLTPVCGCGGGRTVRPVTKKPMTPSPGEVRRNPRSRSAKLRAVEKL